MATTCCSSERQSGDHSATLRSASSEQRNDAGMDVVVSIHSLLRWVVLAAALVALIVAALAWFGSATTDRQGRLATLVFVIALDVQVVIGILIYGVGNFWQYPNAQIRIEHPVMMLLALAVSHLAAARA